jgi:hypothetical protein
MSALTMLFASSLGSDVSAGAALTLWFPIACTIIMLGFWLVVIRKRRRGR